MSTANRTRPATVVRFVPQRTLHLHPRDTTARDGGSADHAGSSYLPTARDGGSADHAGSSYLPTARDGGSADHAGSGYLPTARDGGSAENAGAVFSPYILYIAAPVIPGLSRHTVHPAHRRSGHPWPLAAYRTSCTSPLRPSLASRGIPYILYIKTAPEGAVLWCSSPGVARQQQSDIRALRCSPPGGLSGPG